MEKACLFKISADGLFLIESFLQPSGLLYFGLFGQQQGEPSCIMGLLELEGPSHRATERTSLYSH